MTVAIILAKGTSRRLPRKNVADVCGLPLVAWSCIQATCSQLIDHSFVATDDEQIAGIASDYGCEAIEPPDLPADRTPNPELHYDLNWIAGRYGVVDKMVVILPTCPLRLPWDFDEALRLLGPDGHVIPITYQREMQVYRFISPRMAVLEQQSTRWRLADQGGSFSCWETSYWRTHEGAVTDISADAWQSLSFNGRPGEVSRIDTERVVYGMQPWQKFDVDDAMDLDHVRLFHEFYIMRNGGVSWYEQYKAGRVHPQPWLPAAS